MPTTANKIAAQYDAAKLIAAARALQAEITAQDGVMNAVAEVGVYDAAGELHDKLSDFIFAIEQGEERYAESLPREDTFRAGGWGEV